MKKRTINPSRIFDARPFGFSQVVISDPGKLVFISGQVAWDESMQIVGKNDLLLQTERAMLNLQSAMEAAKGRLGDIVMLRIYKVNFQPGDGTIISQVLTKYFGTEHPPASTWISVVGLANADFMIEIEAQAVI